MKIRRTSKREEELHYVRETSHQKKKFLRQEELLDVRGTPKRKKIFST